MTEPMTKPATAAMYPMVAVPAPRGQHSTCEGASCPCCVDARADLIQAVHDLHDAWLLGGDYWAEMTRQQPLHPSMRRLLDCSATVEHRHHRGSSAGEGATVAPDAGTEGLVPAPAVWTPATPGSRTRSPSPT